MSRRPERPPPPGYLVAGSTVAMAAILFWVILTTWMPDHWPFGLAEVAVLAIGAIWAVQFSLRPFTIRGSPVLIPLGGAAAIGLIQLIAGHTANRWETWNAVLRWVVYCVAFGLSLQLASIPGLAERFRRWLLYFGFGLSVISVLQLFTSEGAVFWLFPSGYQEGVLGPFLSRDRYAAFIEIILPIALFETLGRPRKAIFYATVAGAMIASVFAGASRAGFALVILESAAILLTALWTAKARWSPAARKANLTFAVLLTGFILLFTTVAGWTRLLDRFQEPDLFQSRREILASTLTMVRANKWSGFGLGTFRTVYPGFAIFDTGDVVDHAHNDWAEWAADGGLPFLACMLAIAALSLPKLIRNPWAWGVLAIWLHAVVDFPMHTPALALWVFVLIGVASVSE